MITQLTKERLLLVEELETLKSSLKLSLEQYSTMAESRRKECEMLELERITLKELEKEMLDLIESYRRSRARFSSPERETEDEASGYEST